MTLNRITHFFLLSPLGERMGEGVMQEIVFVLYPLTEPLPQGVDPRVG